MTDLHSLFLAASGLSAPELASVRAEMDRQFRRMPVPKARDVDAETAGQADLERRPPSQTIGD